MNPRTERPLPFEKSAGDRAGNLQAQAGPRQRLALLLDAVLASLLLLAASPLTRHWLTVIVSNICIFGGIIAAPVVSMVAWIGLVLPTHALLHQMAPALVAASLVWFFLAIVGAHALRLDQHKPD